MQYWRYASSLILVDLEKNICAMAAEMLTVHGKHTISQECLDLLKSNSWVFATSDCWIDYYVPRVEATVQTVGWKGQKLLHRREYLWPLCYHRMAWFSWTSGENGKTINTRVLRKPLRQNVQIWRECSRSYVFTTPSFIPFFFLSLWFLYFLKTRQRYTQLQLTEN